jgi:hypothetical protein
MRYGGDGTGPHLRGDQWRRGLGVEVVWAAPPSNCCLGVRVRREPGAPRGEVGVEARGVAAWQRNRGAWGHRVVREVERCGAAARWTGGEEGAHRSPSLPC